MKEPNIKIKSQGNAYFVLIEGDTRYKCLSKVTAEAIKKMIYALIRCKHEFKKNQHLMVSTVEDRLIEIDECLDMVDITEKTINL